MPGGILSRWREGLRKTSDLVAARIDRVLLGEARVDESALEDLEERLIRADVGVRTSAELVEAVRLGVARGEIGNGESARRAMVRAVEKIVAGPSSAGVDGEALLQGPPHVIVFAGVNGVGKTTTIAKVGARHRSRGRRVLLAAGDTFRAGAVDQLAVWAERIGADIVKQGSGADSASVAFDAVQAARARGADVILVDTAGRLHTKTNLMEEIKKVVRVIGKALPGAPHEVLLVLDATTGQNGLAQAREFHSVLGLTGLVLTKLDGTAKGGIVIQIARDLGLPVRYVGTGEGLDDLEPFDASSYAEALFGGP
ncbi:MAG: signal recognition particle-docking protein FtsY [Nitrospirae bacterium RBG_16_64_22]|nr:MAG: signal recognition particle-docking protein FtsY [Nitrospirae bacterium RBG_16_64_22]